MIGVDKNLEELCIVGKSALYPYANCNICDDICATNYHQGCLKKDFTCQRLKSGNIRVPEEGSKWCLSEYHADDDTSDLRCSLRAVNKLSQDLNAVRYVDCQGDYMPVTHTNYLAEKFFPVTLGCNRELDDNKSPPYSLTFSPPATGLPLPPPPWRVITPHNRSQIDHSWLSTEEHIRDNCLFMRDNPQFRPDHEASQIQTPYQSELSRLRLERLRLEEEMLMEVKRQEELERIRGPQPKWYELRNSRFHYEAKKNNELLRSCHSWQDLFDYRNQLKTKSEEFNKKYYPSNKAYDPTNYVPAF